MPTLDLDSELRTVEGDGDGVAETDIGADEAFSHVPDAFELIAVLRAEVAQLPDEKLLRLRDAGAHSGEKITTATAIKWVADANRIREMIGCVTLHFIRREPS